MFNMTRNRVGGDVEGGKAEAFSGVVSPVPLTEHPRAPSHSSLSPVKRSHSASPGWVAGGSPPKIKSFKRDVGVMRITNSAALGAGMACLEDEDPALEKDASLDAFLLFMKILLGLALGCMLLSLVVLGVSGLFIDIVLMICIGAFWFSMYLTRWIMKQDVAPPAMRRVAQAIREGSEGFLSVQYNTIATIACVVAAILFLLYLFRRAPSEEINRSTFAFLTTLSFVCGAFCSALAGYMGVWVSVRVNVRVAHASGRLMYGHALQLAFRGGAISALLSAALCILGLSLLYLFCFAFFVSWWGMSPHQVPMMLAGYGFGASFVALFMQLGGGIYTKAADVGADMVGKVEKNIPEDDPRNPAVIADLVGDNVGDCAGSMADVFESIAAEIIGTMILGSALAHEARLSPSRVQAFTFFPLIIHAFDLVVSGIGIVNVRALNEDEDPIKTFKRSYLLSMTFAVIGFASACRILLYTPLAPDAWWHFALCGLIGILTSWLLILITQYYTDYAFGPVRRIAAAAQTGHGTNIIAGVSVGLESCAGPIIVISIALLSSFLLGKTSGLPEFAAGVFGTAVATMGMLCTAVFILAMNNFGPIADNAGGIVEMSGEGEAARVITDKLDAVGNVTKAAAKGYAVGGSALACFVLFQAYMDEISTFANRPFHEINLTKVENVVGGMLGIMMVFLFTGWAIRAVGQTAQKVVWEVRRQFRTKPGIIDFTEKPDYNHCVSIVTRAALGEMVRPALLALGMPVGIAVVFSLIGVYYMQPLLAAEVCGSFLLFGTLSGLMMAIFLDNAGGAWDNAKKYIEATGGKGSDAHKASVTGDTVGDPFKDTAGPSLHVIITTMATTILVISPLLLGLMPQAPVDTTA